MSAYIIELNTLEENPPKNEVIQGKSATEALKQRFATPLYKVNNKEAENADVTIVKGYIRENGKIKYQGRATRQFYKVDKEAI